MWRRFSGEHLDTPFDRIRGEAPRELVILAFKTTSLDDRSKTKLITDCLHHIFRSFLVPAINGDLVHHVYDSVPAVLETLLFIEDMRPVGIEDNLLEIGLKLLVFMKHNEHLAEVIGVSFIRAAAKYVDDDQIGYICGAALAVPCSTVNVALALASSAPQAFASRLLRNFLLEVGQRPALDPADVAKIRECVRLALIPFVDVGDLNMVGTSVASLCSTVAALTHFPRGELIHRAAVEGLALANVPASEIQKFEDKYWDEHPRKDGLGDPKLWREREQLGARVGELVKTRFRKKVPPLRINSFPYAEGALLHLARIALKLGYDIDVHVVPVPYRHVRQALEDGRIDFAAHNLSFYEQIPNSSVEICSPHLSSNSQPMT